MERHTKTIVPEGTYARRAQEATNAICRDLGSVGRERDPQTGLLSNRVATWGLDYLQQRAGANDILFDLSVRGRQQTELHKAATRVVELLKKQKFTVAESLLFLKHVEGMTLASKTEF